MNRLLMKQARMRYEQDWHIDLSANRTKRAKSGGAISHAEQQILKGTSVTIVGALLEQNSISLTLATLTE